MEVATSAAPWLELTDTGRKALVLSWTAEQETAAGRWLGQVGRTLGRKRDAGPGVGPRAAAA